MYEHRSAKGVAKRMRKARNESKEKRRRRICVERKRNAMEEFRAHEQDLTRNCQTSLMQPA